MPMASLWAHDLKCCDSVKMLRSSNLLLEYFPHYSHLLRLTSHSGKWRELGACVAWCQSSLWLRKELCHQRKPPVILNPL